MKAPTFRHLEYKEYKAKRIKAPQELYDQMPKAKEMLATFGIPIFEKEGFEADDIIGTIAKNASDKNGSELKIIILTGDFDTLQLVEGEKIVVYALKKGISDIDIYNEFAIESKYGIKPKQLIDFKGLRGDSSDNIIGVKGIGEKTALDLIQKFQTIENLYEEIKSGKAGLEIKTKTKEILLSQEKEAVFSKYLSTIKIDVPVEFILENAALKPKDERLLADYFEELGFSSLIARLKENYQPKYIQQKLL